VEHLVFFSNFINF